MYFNKKLSFCLSELPPQILTADGLVYKATEGQRVLLQCKTFGSPQPKIDWWAFLFSFSEHINSVLKGLWHDKSIWQIRGDCTIKAFCMFQSLKHPPHYEQSLSIRGYYFLCSDVSQSLQALKTDHCRQRHHFSHIYFSFCGGKNVLTY